MLSKSIENDPCGTSAILYVALPTLVSFMKGFHKSYRPCSYKGILARSLTLRKKANFSQKHSTKKRISELSPVNHNEPFRRFSFDTAGKNLAKKQHEGHAQSICFDTRTTYKSTPN